MYVNKPQRVPPFHFSALCDISEVFSKKIFKKIFKFYFVPSRETVIFQSYRAWKAHFGCLQSVFKAFHEYVLSIFRKPCASWALDIAPTLDVPVLLILFVIQSFVVSLIGFTFSGACLSIHSLTDSNIDSTCFSAGAWSGIWFSWWFSRKKSFS